MKSIPIEKLIQIGFISKPLGFKGELIFAIENGDAETYAGSHFFFIQLEGRPVPFFAEIIKEAGDSSLIVKLEDVNTEAAARQLSGKRIFIEEHATNGETETEWDALIGYTLFDAKHGRLGILEGIEEYPQQLIGTCRVNGKEVLIPLNEDFISEIDDEKKEIRLELPDGLLDVYLK